MNVVLCSDHLHKTWTRHAITLYLTLNYWWMIWFYLTLHTGQTFCCKILKIHNRSPIGTRMIGSFSHFLMVYKSQSSCCTPLEIHNPDPLGTFLYCGTCKCGYCGRTCIHVHIPIRICIFLQVVLVLEEVSKVYTRRNIDRTCIHVNNPIYFDTQVVLVLE